MFTLARYVVRHKVGAVAIIALGVFFLMPSGDEEPVQSSNPWAANQAPAPQFASVEEDGFLDDIVNEAVGYLDEAGMNPMADADAAVNRLDDTAAAYSRVNGR